MNKINQLKSDDEKSSAYLLRIASFIFSLLCSAFLVYQGGDVWFYATHQPQILKIITWALSLVGPLSVLVVLSLNRPKKRWKTVASVLMGISVGSVAAIFYALFIWKVAVAAQTI